MTTAPLPAPIAVGGSYTCEFDGKFCGALAANGGCAQGLTHTNTVTATLLGDESTDTVVEDTTLSSLKVDVCVTSSHPAP